VQQAPQVRADLVICFHNVIGFVAAPSTVMLNLYSMTAPGGYVVVMFPNRYHAAYFNVKRGATQAAADALLGWGRFAEDMPHIHMFTPETASSLCADAGYQAQAVLGFPKFIYPGYEETRIQGDSSVVVDVLSDATTRSEIAKLELEYLYEPAAARGNNIVVIARKQA
jgi:SAM-dependent methyltransferase